MKGALLTALLLAAACAATAQPRIRVEEQSGGLRTEFYLEGKDRPGTMTLWLTFTELHNCDTRPGTTRYEVKYDHTRLVTLKPSDESYGVGYRYEWRYYYMPLDHRPDTAFVYRMPCTTAKPVRVIHTVHVLEKYTKPSDRQERLGYHFALERGDTVYAMRRGVVTEVKVAQPEPGVSFTTNSTNITVEHPDGSFARYICLDPECLFVREGDEVLPSDPLGLAGTYDGEHHKVSIQTFWYETDPDLRPGDEGFVVRRRFFPRFATDRGVVVPEPGGIYTPVADDPMRTREMTKKELKRYRNR